MRGWGKMRIPTPSIIKKETLRVFSSSPLQVMRKPRGPAGRH
jgi:hypothetical protein